MRKLTALVLTTLAAVAGLMWSQLPAQAQGLGNHPLSGTYFSKLTTDSGLAVQSLASFQSDGTAVAMDTSDFGLGGATPGFDSPTVGSWQKVGQGAYRTKYTYFSYDLAGNHTFTVVNTVETAFPTNVPTPGVGGTVSYVADLYLPFQNPATDPPAVPGVASGTGETWLMPN